MIYEQAVIDDLSRSPGSPPGMTASKSSKSSSFHSISSDDSGSILADGSHFEEIGLDDESHQDPRVLSDQHFKTAPNPYSAAFSAEARTATLRQVSASAPRLQYSRSAKQSQRRELSVPQNRGPQPGLQLQVRNLKHERPVGLGLIPAPRTSPLPRTRSSSLANQPPSLTRHRSHSPNLSLNPRDPNLLMAPRRRSWQTSHEKKTALELELECDEDDGDDIPDDLILDNVPISPRPPQARTKSQPSSKAVSPDGRSKERVRSVGNGTPPVAAAQGSFRSPTWKSDTNLAAANKSPNSSGTSSPVKLRAKSWTNALAELNLEAKTLTEKLEEHADELEQKAQRSSTGSMPKRRSSDYYEQKPRVKSALAELPPLRRTNIMIDPLPISKEKEAVLSRTRPSWLPPKDPAEEKRHLKEYQKMMAQSLVAERRRDADKRVRSECRDTAADSLMQLWEDDILPRWDQAIRERRTRELWWRGVAPRSRGIVWPKAIGNDLGLSEKSYKAALGRALEARTRSEAGNGTVDDERCVGWFGAISRDIEERTWGDLRIFQAGGPLHQSLVDVLSAYAMYRSDIGYVSGCNVRSHTILSPLSSLLYAFERPYQANLTGRQSRRSFYLIFHPLPQPLLLLPIS